MPDEQEIVVETPPEQPPQEVDVTEKLLGEEKPEEPLDPGQNEGKKFKPDQSKVPPERFEEVYGKWKGTERKLNELSESLKSKEAVMEEVRKHNQALMEKIEKLSNKAIEAVETVKDQVPQMPQGEPPQIIAARKAMTELEEKKEAALDRLDSKEVIKLDKELRKVERYLEGYEEFMANKRAEAKPKPKKEDPPAPKEQTADPDIEAFQKDASWFGKDPIMTGAAKEYDLYLSGQPEWKDKPFSARLKEVKKTIEERFGNGSQPKPKPSPGAESGLGLSRAPAGSKTVRLNEQQLAVAKGLGITPEDYAKQLNFLGGAI
jgi:uncharacterized coiled-coil protein SlyX